MSVSRRRAAVDFLVYAAIRFAVCLIQAVPLAQAYAFAELLARLGYRIDRRHRRVAAENLLAAFPEKSDAERDRIVRDCYRHFAALIIEIAILPRKLQLSNWRNYAQLADGDVIVPALLSKRPLLIVTSHFGNWELAGYALGMFGFRTYAIARVLDNPYLERFLKAFRQRTGQTIIAKKDDFDRLTDVMKAGGKVATLADQDAGPRGVFVNFFGRPASAHKAVALLAIEFDATLIVTGTHRATPVGTPRMDYVIRCADQIDPREYAGRSDAVKAITQRYHTALESLIREHPEQYFWLHRRWKTRPPVRSAARTSAPAPDSEVKS